MNNISKHIDEICSCLEQRYKQVIVAVIDENGDYHDCISSENGDLLAGLQMMLLNLAKEESKCA